MESVPVAFVDHLAELLGKITLDKCANRFTNVVWERTLELHKTNRWTIDLYIRKSSDGWNVLFRSYFPNELWMDVQYTAGSVFIGVLNQYSHNFFSQQATNIQRLTLKEVDRSEDYELLVKLIAMENLEECEIHNFDRKLNFIAVEACVVKWKANEQFRFYLTSSGAYSKQEIEPLFREADEDGFYALIVEGRTSRYAGLRLGQRRKERYTSCGSWLFE
ncbi:hypothetical protein QR680_007925 [Steinernema hermaphroditum]|uniref:Uncharacterized protein n=1 Tax=Steinernema hermaphroditum TaxID=289476 RepID=A0AA39IGW2_9BILA|nr:hypothetical protein QR680_007925 [Steinernema hermaphroditum]